MKILSNNDCQALWNTKNSEYGTVSIVNSMLCAKKANSTACFGDSGGKFSRKVRKSYCSYKGKENWLKIP